eukprot:896039-Pyramimonas_sp.AAC.1
MIIFLSACQRPSLLPGVADDCLAVRAGASRQTEKQPTSDETCTWHTCNPWPTAANIYYNHRA